MYDSEAQLQCTIWQFLVNTTRCSTLQEYYHCKCMHTCIYIEITLYGLCIDVQHHSNQFRWSYSILTPFEDLRVNQTFGFCSAEIISGKLLTFFSEYKCYINNILCQSL